jgi:hypothetical protein
MRVITSMIRKMGREPIYGSQVIGIRANLKMIIDMVMERCFGVMEPALRVSG